MMRTFIAAAAILTLGLAIPGHADSWKDESGKGRGRGEWKQEYRDGDCKIERKWEKNGGYKEKVKCGGGRGRGYSGPGHAYGVPVTPLPRAVGPVPGIAGIGCNRDLIGGVLGGAAGGLLGNQIGKGDGRTLATVGGAIIGVLVGGTIGRGMDQVDQACAAQSLEYGGANQSVVWRNPDGAQYEMIPTKTYEAAGTQCREFTTRAVIGGRPQEAYGRACRQPDGSWQVAN